jgi:hypothetical protein
MTADERREFDALRKRTDELTDLVRDVAAQVAYLAGVVAEMKRGRK